MSALPLPATARSPRAAFRSLAADPRLCLVLTVLYGLAVWRANVVELCLGLAALGARFLALPQRNRPAKSAVKRLIPLVLFWPCLKVLADLIFAAWPLFFAPRAPQASATILLPAEALSWKVFWSPSLAGAGILLLRLAALAGLCLALLQAASPRNLGLGLAAMLRPILGERAWKVALALTFMAQYLFFMPEAAHQAALGALSRKLPGFTPGRRPFPASLVAPIGKYACLAVQIFRHLALRAEAQAWAAATRKLDAPPAWHKTLPATPGALTVAAVLALPALYCLL